MIKKLKIVTWSITALAILVLLYSFNLPHEESLYYTIAALGLWAIGALINLYIRKKQNQTLDEEN